MVQDCYLQAKLQNDIQYNWGGGEKGKHFFLQWHISYLLTR